MDKLKMAHEYALEMAKQGIPLKSCKELGWKYADAMQAEADSRVNKERPSVLQEWQPDWSVAPEWAKWWAMDKDGVANWFDDKPSCDCGYLSFGDALQCNLAPSFNYRCDWKDSLRKRP